jgi:transcriptional regulator with XRE-family HTH domain
MQIGAWALDDSEYIRDRIRAARKHAGLTQRQLADLLGINQASISDIERGKVQVNAPLLSQLARRLRQEITYFYPPGAEVQTEREGELLSLFRLLSDPWKETALQEMRIHSALYQKANAYERAGVPEEFYSILLNEERQILEAAEAIASEGIATAEELEQSQALYRRFLEWRKTADLEVDEESED